MQRAPQKPRIALVKGRFRVLVVDDSALSRDALTRAIEADPLLEVVGVASTGEQSLELAGKLLPDLITMDLVMPGIGGLKAIELHMKERATPIVVISERSTSQRGDVNYEAIARGALELIPKSAVFATDGAGVQTFAQRLRLLVEGATAPASPASPFSTDALPLSPLPPLLVGLGASTGGPRALASVLGALKKDFPVPIALVQHMADDFFDSFVRFLADCSELAVVLAEQGMQMKPGVVYVAPPRQELFVREGLVVKLLPPPANALISPTVDSLFFSMASTFKERAVAVLMTGMGDDGAQGLLRMRRMGARTVAQDRATSAVYGMPKAAVELGAAEVVAALEDLPRVLNRLSRGGDSSKSGFLPQVAVQTAKKRVLVVDDDSRSLAVTRRHLEGAGYEVQTLDNPFLVAGTLRKMPADLLVLESELTTTRGAVVAKALQEHTQLKVKVFLYSSLAESKLPARARECNAIGYLKKDESGAPLVRALREIIGGPGR